MKTPARYITILLIAVAIFFAGYMANRQSDPSAASAYTKQASSYTCPMHPQYKSSHSGDCPICGMRLELERADAGAATNSETSGTIPVNRAWQQMIGVQTDEVRQSAGAQHLRVPGRVTVDDQRLYRILAAADGWILNLGANTVGRFVKRNEVLASYYTRDLLSSERLFLLSTDANDPLHKADPSYATIRTSTSANPQFPVDSLRGLGMSDLQIEEIQRTRNPMPRVDIYSPISGYVIARNVSPQQRFDKGTEFYRIADISHVWVMTDILEKDREFLKPGAMATVRYQGREYQAHMSDALPQFDPQSRILKTRFELDNPGMMLLPDVFVDVELHLDPPAAITVPADAVVDSGRHKIVYVERASSEFEPREIETGWRMGDRVQVTKGLEPGERVVTSGNFLIDSEARMKLVSYAHSDDQASPKKTVKDPVCGMDIDPNGQNTLKAEYKGQTYHFCMQDCKTKFLNNPEKYTGKKQPDAPKMVKDPVCGMDVDSQSANTLKTEYKGKTYHFCNESCKKSFEADPEKYINKGMAPGHNHMNRT